MAKAKKNQKYVPATKYPAARDYRLLTDEKYKDFDTVVGIYDANVRGNGDHYQNNMVDRFKDDIADGNYTKENWPRCINEYRYNDLLAAIWRHTDEFKTINEPFMAEFHSRDDLKEIYREAAENTWWWYHNGENKTRNDAVALGWDQNPTDYMMYRSVMRRGMVDKKIELARETPYQEGDLVLLRLPYVGHKDVDPLFINPWSPEGVAGATTPDRSTLRLGTVVSVTDKTEGWRGSRGSKVIQLIWIGKDEMTSVQEKYIKWHERPTKKNGGIK